MALPHGQRRDRTALVLYGSETGNSQDVAEDLGRMAERLHFVTRVTAVDHVEINILSQYTLVIFAVSTTGQGEFPKNARKFWKSLLRKRLPPGCLNHVKFTTFGLGDSSYPRYNIAARKLHKRLEQLGAKEVYPRGEADEQHDEGIDGTFLSWSFDLRKHLLATFPLLDGREPIPPDVLLPPKFRLEFSSSNQLEPQISQHSGEVNGCSTPDMKYEPPVEYERSSCPQLKEPHSAEDVLVDTLFPPVEPFHKTDSQRLLKLINNKRITPDGHWQDVRQLDFLLSDDNEYEPGDTITIYPKNFPADIDALIDLQGWNNIADKPLKIRAEPPDFFDDEQLLSLVPPGMIFRPESTLRELFLISLDITAIPKRHFFETIAHHTDDPTHKERLLEFANPVFSDELYDYTSRPRRSILEVLQDFPSVKLPWKWICGFIPPIRGRKYSICSGGFQRTTEHKGFIRLSILVAIVKYRTVLRKVRQGLCSRYLASLKPGDIIPVQLETPGTFSKLAIYNEPQRPCIFIAPGTGIAPCRSLIWERSQIRVEDENAVIGPSYLFFGGRNKNADYFYKDEWMLPVLRTTIFTAFSRDQKEKIYVQDVIRREAKLLTEMFLASPELTPLIFVCGSSGNMPKAVRAALVDVLLEAYSPASREEMEAKLARIEKVGHYIQETW